MQIGGVQSRCAIRVRILTPVPFLFRIYMTQLKTTNELLTINFDYTPNGRIQYDMKNHVDNNYTIGDITFDITESDRIDIVMEHLRKELEKLSKKSKPFNVKHK